MGTTTSNALAQQTLIRVLDMVAPGLEDKHVHVNGIKFIYEVGIFFLLEDFCFLSF